MGGGLVTVTFPFASTTTNGELGLYGADMFLWLIVESQWSDVGGKFHSEGSFSRREVLEKKGNSYDQVIIEKCPQPDISWF